MNDRINKISEFQEFLQKEKKDLVEKKSVLEKDQRKDESNIVKIRLNIYDIFHTMFVIACKQTQEERIKEEFLKKIDSIPMNWMTSYEQAKLHGDIEKILVEETKLASVKEIQSRFIEIWG